MTLVELLSAIILLSILVVVLGELYILGLDIWDRGYHRQSAHAQMSQAFERMAKALRQAKQIDALTESSVSFTADLGSGDQPWRMYLYHPLDAEPNPPYNQAAYELKFADGDIFYGNGAVLAVNIQPPAERAFTQTGKLITIDLTRLIDDAALRYRSRVRLRNL